MGIFRRKKPKTSGNSYIDPYVDTKGGEGHKHQVEHQALDFCEQLMASSRELDETKKEYRQVMDYLNDIQKLEDLPEEEMNAIKETAGNIVGLNKMREELSHKERRMSDAQFAQLEQLEDEIPDDILRLQANESYQSMVRRDMDNLEGEKSEWNYYRESITREQKVLKVVLWVVLAVFLLGFSGLLYVKYGLYRDTTLYLMIFLFGAAVVSGFCILRMQNNQSEFQRAQASINRAITISNQMKAKYVNVTNAVDYACEKFHVRNSMELGYLWDQYLEMVKERETARRANDDLEYFSRKLVRELRNYQFHDASIWVSQAVALVDKKEMVEVKHYLIVRRQKLRSRIEKQVEDIQESRKQLSDLLKEHQEYRQEILDVLRSIDQICGT